MHSVPEARADRQSKRATSTPSDGEHRVGQSRSRDQQRRDVNPKGRRSPLSCQARRAQSGYRRPTRRCKRRAASGTHLSLVVGQQSQSYLVARQVGLNEMKPNISPLIITIYSIVYSHPTSDAARCRAHAWPGGRHECACLLPVAARTRPYVPLAASARW